MCAHMCLEYVCMFGGVFGGCTPVCLGGCTRDARTEGGRAPHGRSRPLCYPSGNRAQETVMLVLPQSAAP